jgi:acetolactate synthase-1/2/3 large subunit
MGALGIRVEAASAFPAALAEALAAERPAVIDVVTDIEALAPVAVA